MAIAAQLDEIPEAARKPREPRLTLRLEAPSATASGTATQVLVHNISATGLLLESEAPLALDERIAIDLPQAGATWAKVIWVSDRFVGCQFDAALSSAALSAAQLRSAVGQRMDLPWPSEGLRDEAFGVRLRRLRKERKLTLSQIADQLGVSKPTVWAWEQGKARPVEGRIEALADALGVPTADLQSGHHTSELDELLLRSREQIARTVGTKPEKVRIMIEL